MNFCTYPKNSYNNLHSSDIDPKTKIIDLFTDILLVSMSSDIISNSRGGFIKLLKDCRKNQNHIQKMYTL